MEKKEMNNKTILPVLGLVLVGAIGVYFYTTSTGATVQTAALSETVAETDAPEAPLQDPVALVDGDKISKEEFLTHYNRAKERFAKVGRAIPPSLEERIKQSIFQQLVEDRLVQKEAQKLALTITSAEKKTALDEYQARMGGKEAFENFLKELTQ